MKSKVPVNLEQLARSHGIQTSYLDNTGREQFASEETLRILLEKLGVDDQAQSIRSGLEPVIVAWQRKGAARLRLSESVLNRGKVVLRRADGTEEEISRRSLKPISSRKRGSSPLYECLLPKLPTGYHSLSLDGEEERAALLISAPTRLYNNADSQWGGFLPMYAAHTKDSWGAGNLSDWKDLATWLAGQGARVVGTLPILAAFLARPICEPSPYSPASRLFWNEFFIDATAAPEYHGSAAAKKLANSAAFQRKLSAFRGSDFIDYKEQWAARRRVLEIMAQRFFSRSSARRKQFNDFLKRRPEVQDYAKFRAACDQSGTGWQAWTTRARNGRLSASDYAEETKNFYLYVQFLAQEQLDDVLEACRSSQVKFYLDLPLGVNPDGYDVWRYRDFFATGVSAGAPPDSFFTKGQDWGFSPLCPRRARELRYRYVIDYLRFQMRHTGLLRIDHVMGLHRLWWVPHGRPASEGAYVRYRDEELYAILSVESHLHKTMLVGENLGTVPPEVNKSMDRHQMRRMYVLQYEQQPTGRLREPEGAVVASVNTHDMPSFAAHWGGLDLADRNELGLIRTQDMPRERKQREALRRNLVSFLREKGFLKKGAASPEAVIAAVLKFLASSPAETVLINLEDLWCEERSQNVPGTSTERPNWRRKARLSIEQIKTDPGVARILAAVRESRTR